MLEQLKGCITLKKSKKDTKLFNNFNFFSFLSTYIMFLNAIQIHLLSSRKKMKIVVKLSTVFSSDCVLHK